jgi:hypothetical protein
MESLINDMVSVNDFYKNRSLSDKLKYEKVFGLYLDCCEKSLDEKDKKKCLQILKEFNTTNNIKI